MEHKAGILVADDNVSLRKTMSFILERKGHHVTTAGNGLEAIEHARRQHFDMIFLDIKMPVMDGVEACRQIKKIQSAAVVMVMTAYAVEDLVSEALAQGAGGVLYKPLDMDKVLALIEEAA